MEKSKLLELLQKLHSRELSRFSDFVHSPYHNKNEILKRLCDWLLQDAPEFKNKRRLQPERAYAHLYPGQAFDAGNWHRATSQLLDLLYDFLRCEQHASQPAAEQLTLLQSLRRRKAFKHYDSESKRRARLWQEQAGVLGRAETDWLLYRSEREANARFIDSGERRYDPHLQNQYAALHRFFLLEHWRLACDMVSRNALLPAEGKRYVYDALPALEDYVQTSELHASDFLLGIYRLALRMLQSSGAEQETLYCELKQAVERHAAELSDADLVDVYGYLLNYSIRQINRGVKAYYREALAHYRFLVERRLMFFDGYLPAANYKNIVTIALALEEYEWTLQFIEAQRLALPPDVRENAYRYNLASYYYAVGDHKKALQSLHDVIFTDVSYHVGAKIIQLKSYYELDETEALFSLFDSFSGYLRRNKDLPESQRAANLNLVKLTKKIYQYKEKRRFLRRQSPSAAEYQALEERLASTAPLANKLWLENALSALK